MLEVVDVVDPSGLIKTVVLVNSLARVTDMVGNMKRARWKKATVMKIKRYLPAQKEAIPRSFQS